MFYDGIQDPLCKAAKFVDQAIGVDNTFLDLSSLLGIETFTNEPTIGGCEPIEYPNTNFQVSELAPLKVKVLPIELQERLKQFQCNCQMGIFPQVSRAWLTIDNELYLWTYDEGSDIAYYDGLNEVILSVALVCPKPNVFQAHITHVLCIATHMEVVLLGVTFNATMGLDGTTSYNDLQILHEPLFTIATDNVHMTSITASKEGRIFMAGNDGCIYEIDYHGELGWFGKRSCKKINHSTGYSSLVLPAFMTSYFSKDVDPLVQLCCDESRKILIARSRKSNLEIFHLGQNGNKFSRVAGWDFNRTLQKVNKSVDSTRIGSIVHVAPVPVSDSERIHLVATTSTGARLYYTTRGHTDNPQHPALSPTCLTLVHIRNPPSLPNSTSPHRLPRASFLPIGQINDVHLAAYSQGTHLMSSSSTNDEGDIFWTFSQDSFSFSHTMSESYESTQLAGKVWDIKELPANDNQTMDLVRDSMAALSCVTNPPAIVTQHYSGNRKFAVVSSVGVCIAMKLSPYDQLQQLLTRNPVDSEPVKAYFKLLKEQAMTSCIALMCSKNASNPQIENIAMRAYNIYKWESTFAQTLAPEHTSTPMAGQHHRNYNIPMSPITQHSHLPPPQFPATHHFGTTFNTTSLNHRSLYLYLARILRPVWSEKVVHSCKPKDEYLMSRLNSEQISTILHKCQEFHLLLRNHPSILAHVPSTSVGVSNVHGDSFSLSRNMSVRGVDFETDETTSLRTMESLLDVCCQCISVWRILADHQFHIVANKLKQEDKVTLSTATFGQLVQSHRSLFKQLISTLLDFYIDDDAVTDIISLRLRESCPMLYSTQDQAQTKGNECVKLAKSAANPHEKKKLIQMALQQYKVTINSPTPSSIYQQQNTLVGDLPSMCTRLASVGMYSGVVELALMAASRRDPNNLAQHFYLSSKQQEDVEGARFYALRCECYKPIMEALDYLIGLCSEKAESKGKEGLGGLISGIFPSFFSSNVSVGDNDLPSPLKNGYVMSSQEAAQQMNEMANMIMKSEDRMAHFAVFDWMNSRENSSEDLLSLTSPYLEQYLRLESGIDDQNHHHHLTTQDLIKQKQILELLAKYYRQEKKFSLAARIYDKLAMKAGSFMTLKERQNYMMMASMCLESSASRADSEFMHEVRDKSEVINLQMKVMKDLEKCASRPQRMLEEALQLLNSQLFDISELYSSFAIQFELSACKLAIVRASGLRDQNLVDSIWKEIIDRELFATVGEDVHQRIEVLSNYLVTIGKEFFKEENYFPLELLVRHLEELNVKNGFYALDLTFVARSLLDVGVAAEHLHDVYEKLFRRKDSFWKNSRRQYHLAEIDAFIMKEILEQLLKKSLTQERRQILARCLDGISFYLVELQSDLCRDDKLIGGLKELQIKMGRLER